MLERVLEEELFPKILERRDCAEALLPAKRRAAAATKAVTFFIIVKINRYYCES
jgi:hypothetical protein